MDARFIGMASQVVAGVNALSGQRVLSMGVGEPLPNEPVAIIGDDRVAYERRVEEARRRMAAPDPRTHAEIADGVSRADARQRRIDEFKVVRGDADKDIIAKAQAKRIRKNTKRIENVSR